MRRSLGRGRLGAKELPPKASATGTGFAGGIGPDNLVEVLRDIGPREAPFWIDMESGVRSGRDFFDLGLCREVLRRCALFIRGEDR